MLIDAIDAILHHGLSWLTVIAIVNLYFKDRRRKREHKKMDHIIELLEGLNCVDSTVSKRSIQKRNECSVSSIRTFAHFVQGKKVYRYITKLNLRRVSKMNKWLNPSLLTIVVGFIVTYLNQQFGFHLNTVQIVGILVVIGHYAVTQEIVHAKLKANGTFAGYTLNSSKLFVVIIGSLAIGFCSLVGIQANPADIVAFVAAVISYVSSKGYHDVKQGGSNAQYTDTTGPTK